MDLLPLEIKIELLYTQSLDDIFNFCSSTKSNLKICKNVDFWYKYLKRLTSRQRVDVLLRVVQEFPSLYSIVYRVINTLGPELNFDTLSLLMFYLEMADKDTSELKTRIVNIRDSDMEIHDVNKYHLNDEYIMKAKIFINSIIDDLNNNNNKLSNSLFQYGVEYLDACLALFDRTNTVETLKYNNHINAIEDYISARIDNVKSIYKLINLLVDDYSLIQNIPFFPAYLLASLVKTHKNDLELSQVIISGITNLIYTNSYLSVLLVYTGLVDNSIYIELDRWSQKLYGIHEGTSIYNCARNPIDKQVLNIALNHTSEVYGCLYRFYTPDDTYKIVNKYIIPNNRINIFNRIINAARKDYEFEWATNMTKLIIED